MASNRFQSYWAPAQIASAATPVTPPKFVAVPQVVGGVGLQSWQVALYLWAKSTALAHVGSARQARRIWHISAN